MSYKEYLSSIEEIIEDAKQGKMFILVDDENRENEGDLVIPAEMADADAVNFMAKNARGLVCLALDKKRVEELNLPLMTQHNGTRLQTAFTVSIESRTGVTTGISAADRAKTISVAINENTNMNDIVSPGHVFPLKAKEGGVLVRAGHTEAAVDIARLAGLNESGVICEIMNDDGTMARMPDLIKFSKEHNLKIATIADLISYRIRNDRIVKRELETIFNSKYGGEFKMVIYSNMLEYAEHIALVKGDISPDKPVNVRVHALDVLSDVLGDIDYPRSKQKSMEIISEEGGVLILIRENSSHSLSHKIKSRQNEKDDNEISHQSNNSDKEKDDNEIRNYGVGAQILLDLGVRDMVLLTNSERSIVGLDGYGLSVKGFRSLT